MVDWQDIQTLGNRIAAEFDPVRIILFGSHAYGTATADSDVDVLVILTFEGKAFRKAVEILNRVDPAFAVDLIVRRPDETNQRYADGDPVIREALDRGTVLYERDG